MYMSREIRAESDWNSQVFCKEVDEDLMSSEVGGPAGEFSVI